MHQGKRLTLLHLSDPQFGDEHGFARDTSTGSLANRLTTSLVRLLDTDDVRPDLVVISGDLAERGLPAEFEEVEAFIRTLAQRLSIDIQRFVVVPGNHDISRAKCQAYFLNSGVDGVEPRSPYWPKYEPYAKFFARLYGDQSDQRFTEDEPFTFYEYPGLGTVVAGLNSTIADSHLDKDHYGFVGEEQLRHFAQRLRPFADKGYLRIGVVHHDPTKSRQDDGLEDAELLDRMLSPHLDVLLHGHTHDDKIRLLGGAAPVPVRVLGIGSAGVRREARPSEVANQYQILRFSSTAIERGMLRYEPDRKEFIGDNRGDLHGKQWLVQYAVPTLSRATAAFASESAEDAAPRDELVDAIAQYRERMARAYRGRHFAEQSGLLADETTLGSIDLIQLFVVPQVEKREERPPQHAPGHPTSPLEEENREALPREMAPSFPENADRVLFDAAQPWVVIVGGPGSGKSTLSNWLVLELCVAGEKLPDAAMAAFVPVRIEMRRFVLGLRAHQGKPYTFFDYFNNEDDAVLLDLLRSDRLRKLAGQGRVWWIFDGLDEVLDVSERQHCIEMIGAVKQRYGGRGLITSREVGSDGLARQLSPYGIPHYAILDFDNDRLSELLKRFRLPHERHERLTSAIARSPALHEVCRVPLVATMVALLSRHRDIPERRRALYGELIELLVDKWEESKGVGPEAGVLGRFDYGLKTTFLTSLAYRMMTQTDGGGGNAIREDELRDFTIAFCVEEFGETRLVAVKTAKQLLSRLRDRHGVLVYWGADTYGFVHRSFLDALAAEELGERYLRGPGQDELARLVRTSWQSRTWRECLVLALGGIAEKRPADVLRILQDAFRAVRFYEADFTLFASFCIRVLSESGSALETEPLHGFALRLTELIRICGTGYFYEGEGGQRTTDVLLAFREVGARWPGASILRAWALDEETLRRSFWDNNIARLAIVTTSPAEHPSLLEEMLVRCAKSNAHEFALLESCLWRQWSDGEIQRHMTATLAASEKLALRTANVFWFNGYPIALDGVITLMTRAQESSVRLEAAARLLLEIKWTPASTNKQLRAVRKAALTTCLDIIEKEANKSTLHNFVVQSAFVQVEDPGEEKLLTEKLSEWLNSGFNHRADFAALVLAGRGNPKAIGALEAMARLTEDNHARLGLSALVEIAEHQQLAHDALLALLADAHLLHGNVTDSLLNWAAKKLSPDIVRTFFTRLFESTNAPSLKLFIARKLRGIAALESFGTDLLLDVARSSADAETRERAMDSLCDYRPPLGASALNQLLGIYQATTVQPGTRFSIACEFIRPEIQDPTFRKTGEEILVELVAPEFEVTIRRMAAFQLRDLANPLGEITLRGLAQSAIVEEDTRQFAARQVRDLPTLRRLAESAESEQVRNDASHFLALLDARRALLRVGRLRRAIVSLSGQRVGILEETPTGSRFAYDIAWLEHPRAKAIAPSLPLRRLPYESEGLHPFFENLLPEGWLLQIARKTLGVSGQDVFGLLLTMCRDCIGAVEIIPEPDEDDV
jgi:HipA-like protein